MDQRSDDIRQDIESTRASLDEKLDTLETRARQTFDLKHQVDERPWMMLGAAVAAGYVLGSLGGEDDTPRWHGQPVTTTDYNQHVDRSTTSQPGPSRTEGFLSQFDDEIDMLKTAAISTLTNFLRDAIREYVPAMGQQLDRVNRDRSRTPSSAPNTSFSTGAGRTGFDSPAETTSYGPNWVAPETSKSQAYYPPGSTGTSTTSDHDYVKTYHPPSETDRERAIGDEPTYK